MSPPSEQEWNKRERKRNDEKCGRLGGGKREEQKKERVVVVAAQATGSYIELLKLTNSCYTSNSEGAYEQER